MTKHEWSEWHEMPTDAPKNKDERLLVKVLNAIACAIFTPLLFAVWIWCGIQGASQEPATTLGSVASAAPFESIMILACAILMPFAALALILSARK